jgi:ribonuclease HI
VNTIASTSAEVLPPPPVTGPNSWFLYTDVASNKDGPGAGLVLIDPEGVEVTYALRLGFPSTNNEAEYEAMLAGLRLAICMRVKGLSVRVDSLLVENQVKGDFEVREEALQKYVDKVKELMMQFDEFEIMQIPRG